jgi:S1-C subfamily serine protease
MILALCSMMCAPALHARAQSARPPQKNESPLSPAARARVRKAVASVGLILVRNSSDGPGQKPRARGSAVVVQADGVIATNLHVITDSRSGQRYDEVLLSVSSEGSTTSKNYRLKTLVINKSDDLALLRVESDAAGNSLSTPVAFPALEIGDSMNVHLLDDIFIIGFPEKGGSSVTVNRGTVEGRDVLGRWIKTDARLIHGNSGGAAVNIEGKLIGIPTKVVADDQWIDKDGDGFPDDYKRYGAVGFLKPAYLVSTMLAGLSSETASHAPITKQPQMVESATRFAVQGRVELAGNGQPIAGAVVGLVPPGQDVTQDNLLAWGGTNADGQFKLNKPIPPGRYTLRAKGLGYLPYARDVEITDKPLQLVIEMRPRSGK